MNRTRRAISFFLLGCSSFPHASGSPVHLNLGGTASSDSWSALTVSGGFTDVESPGTGAWPTTGGWVSYDPGSGSVGAIASNASISSGALLYKISNGADGGPYPADTSMYFGGASAQINLNGGTLGFVDPTPVAGVKTVAFQVEIGEAFGYDFYNHALPVLEYTTASGSGTLAAAHSARLSQVYSGGKDIYKSTWGVQFDLNGVAEPILSYQVRFTGVQHAQVYSARLDQSSAARPDIVFPQAAEWAGPDGNWSEGAKWSGGAVPPDGGEVSFGNGTGVNADSVITANAVKIRNEEDFTIAGPGTLAVGGGGILVNSTAAAGHEVSATLHLTEFNLINIAEQNVLTLSGRVIAPGSSPPAPPSRPTSEPRSPTMEQAGSSS